MREYRRIIQNNVIGDFLITSQDNYITRLAFSNSKDFVPLECNDSCDILIEAERQIQEYFSGKRFKFDLPLKIANATDFEKTVYDELIKVPYGATASYRAIAERCGRINAFRAAGNAIGKNPIPIIIPCHRIIKSSGALGGFTGGTYIKEALLELEKKYLQI